MPLFVGEKALIPFMDQELAEVLKKPSPSVPILVITSTILTREWAKDHGCAGFLRKPIDPADMLEEIQRCLGESQS